MIKVNLAKVLIDKKMTSKKLAIEVGITEANLSNFKNGKMKGVRLDTLNRICAALDCQPGDIFEYVVD
ncbi:helix-turn-helix domain-containing protein [Weissella sagaensis]|uniref:helix-turn-helix domain-containing protein n=1 Tax=Weissella sagaensis TaxID=2559928 RepID=UPI0013EB6A1D|nr:helix-turn-helix transcriptional regulator [Weissella sagaensis]